MKGPGAGTDIPAEIVRRAKRGDEDALERLIRSLYPLVSRWALVKTGSADDAEDVTQEVMIRVSRYLKRFDDRSKISTWAYQITSNAVADHYRRGRRGLRIEPIEDRGEPADESQQDTADTIDETAAASLVRMFFSELPEKQREVFDLADLQGHRSSEVAELLGMNATTVRGHLFRARRFIRKRILESNPKLVEAYGREL